MKTVNQRQLIKELAKPGATTELLMMVNRLAATYPDRVYKMIDSCDYAPDDFNPCGCIMGGGLRMMGLDPDRSCEGLGIVRYMPGADKTAVRLYKIQDNQDAGATWAEAVAWAEKNYRWGFDD